MFEKVFGEKKKIQERLNFLEEEYQKKEKIIEELNKKLQESEKNKRIINTEKSHIFWEIEKLKGENLRLMERYEKSEKRCEFLEEELIVTKKTLMEITENLKSEREKNHELTIENGKLKELVSLHLKEKNELMKEKEDLLNEKGELKKEIEDLKNTIAEKDEKIRIIQKKSEHNRRAWLITQLQLDMAEDKICLLTKGQPRREYK